VQKLLIFGLMWAIFSFAVAGNTDPSTSNNLVALEKGILIELDAVEHPLEIDLPSLTSRPKRSLKKFRFTSKFLVPNTVTSKLWAVYFLSLYDGGTVSINGVVIGQIPTSNSVSTVRNARPYLFHLPADLIHIGFNQLSVEWGSRETLTLVSKIFVGPAETLTPPFEQRLFWQNEMAQVAFVFALVVALMLLVVYYLRRDQKSYLLLGLSAIGCAIVVFVYVLPAMPYWFYPYWRFIHISGIALFTQCAWLFLIRETRPNQYFFSRLCIAWGLLGPSYFLLNYWISDVSFSRLFEGAWGVGAGVIGFYPIGLLLRSAWRQLTWRKVIFLAATLLAIVVGISDVALQSSGISPFGNVGYSLQVVSSLWLCALTSVLLVDFVSSLTVQDQLHASLSKKLAEREVELARLYEIDRCSAREKATLDERERIMQDIHDGLGSQLITSLALSERGALNSQQTSFLLRESIDDLRLAIDTMSESADSFSVAAGNLKVRMEPRLAAAGIILEWDNSGILEPNLLKNSQILPLLRIIQEAVTNSLKHSLATKIEVLASIQDETLLLKIVDDGIGFDGRSVRMGKGLSGIEKRARAVGALLEITGINGTAVVVRLPLGN
jgi:signal transduction histidine kinase